MFDWLFDKPKLDLYEYAARQERERIRAVRAALDGPYGDNATLFETTKKLVEAAKFPESRKFAAKVCYDLLDHCDNARIPCPHDEIALKMVNAAAGLYVAERLNDMPPDPSRYGVHGDNQALGALRDLLIRQQRKAAYPTRTLDALSSALKASFLALTKRLPPAARERFGADKTQAAETTLPLCELLPDLPTVIGEMIAPFQSAEGKELGLFQWINDRLESNAAARSEQRRAAAAPAEIIAAYFHDTPLEWIFEAQVPFSISISQRLEHTAIVAGSGWGKTQLLQTIIVRDLQQDDPPSFIIVDSTNRMVEQIQQLDLFAGRLRDRVVIIDPERSPAPALNMFDIATTRMSSYSADMRERVQSEIIALFGYIFSSNDNALTDPMRTAFSFIVRLLLTVPNANITTLRKLLEDDPKSGYEASAFKEYMDRLDPTARDFFRVQYFTDRLRATRNSILQRVSSVISIPAFERMFSTVNRIDFFDEMQRGTCILVNTSEALLKDGSALFGRYIIARVMAAAFERASLPDDQRKPTFLVVDEAAPYFDEQFEKLLTRVRQFKLGVVIAFQHLEQASDKLRSAIASNTSVKYAGGLGYADSRWLAHEMRTSPEHLLSLRKDSNDPPRHTRYACYVRGMDTPVDLTVPFYRLEDMPKMSADELVGLLERNKIRTAYREQTPPPVPERFVQVTKLADIAPIAKTAGAPAAAEPSAAKGDPGEPSDTW